MTVTGIKGHETSLEINSALSWNNDSMLKLVCLVIQGRHNKTILYWWTRQCLLGALHWTFHA